VTEATASASVHKMIHRAKTVGEAENHARSVLKNVLIEGRASGPLRSQRPDGQDPWRRPRSYMSLSL
jgi:hypothetical protein